jgi:hypothetical protein
MSLTITPLITPRLLAPGYKGLHLGTTHLRLYTKDAVKLTMPSDGMKVASSGKHLRWSLAARFTGADRHALAG